MRIPDEEGIKEKRYSYSTNCGWIDWDHALPGLARVLITQIREASMRSARKEKKMSKVISLETTPLVTESKCTVSYEANERAESLRESSVLETKEHKSGMVEFILGGFGVNSATNRRFGSQVNEIGKKCKEWNLSRREWYTLEVCGFSDCIELNRRKLRRQRCDAICTLLLKKTPWLKPNNKRGLNKYIASNNTREGRKKNRGVLIRLLPRIAPEQFKTKRMEAGRFGINSSTVTPTVRLYRSLSEREVFSVAMAVFRSQSREFEELQAWRDWFTSFIKPSSSFSEEDLPSNLIGFYRAARGFSVDEVKTICDVWRIKKSLNKLKDYKFQKNRMFRPLKLPPGGAWPKEFSTISPASLNSEVFRIVSMLLTTPFSSRKK
jgi:hypothetical protein